MRTVEELAADQGLREVASITLQVGEAAGVVPRFLEECYPAAVDRSALLKATVLKIELLPVLCRCPGCGEVYHPAGPGGTCPACGRGDGEMVSGREFLIKEIEAQ